MATIDDLSFHRPTGQFYKTCRRHRYYFGKDPIVAVQRFELEWPYITRGLPVPAEIATTGTTVLQVLDLWTQAQQRALDAGKIKPITFSQYRDVAQFQVSQLGASRVAAGVLPMDFSRMLEAMPDRFGESASTLRRIVVTVRMPWKWAYESGLLDKPMRFGPSFKGPAESVKRVQRYDRGRQTYTADELRRILGLASPMLRAAVLLGINGGYTQSELAGLRESMVDLEGAVIDHLRPKTSMYRTVPLWPETVQAIDAYLPTRTKPRDDARGLLFLSAGGRAMHREWITDEGKHCSQDYIAKAFNTAKKAAGVELSYAGFGKLRATFRTVGDAAGDTNAARRIMGHDLGQGVESSYIRDVGRDRLDKVIEHVHDWLFEGD